VVREHALTSYVSCFPLLIHGGLPLVIVLGGTVVLIIALAKPGPEDPSGPILKPTRAGSFVAGSPAVE